MKKKNLISWYFGTFAGLSRPVWLLSLVMLINRSGTMVIPFLTVYLTQELDYSLTQASFVMASFGGGSVLGSYIGGKLTDVYGYYRIQFWSLFLGGFVFWLLIYMESLWSFCVTIFILSMIADAFRPASMVAVAAYSKEENRTRSYALIRLAINLGWAIGPVVGGILAVTVGYNWLFFLDGLTCISAALLFIVALPMKKAKAGEVKEEPSTEPGLPAHKDLKYLLFLFYVLVSSIAFMQLFSTYPVFLKESFLLSEDQIGAVMAINAIMIVLTEMPLVHGLEKRYRPLPIIGIGMAFIGISYVVFNFTNWIGIIIISILFITVGEMLAMPFTNTYAIGRAKSHNRGQYMALFSMTYSVSHIFAPIVGMQLADHYGYGFMWYVVGGLSLLAVMGIWQLEVSEKKSVFPSVKVG